MTAILPCLHSGWRHHSSFLLTISLKGNTELQGWFFQVQPSICLCDPTLSSWASPRRGLGRLIQVVTEHWGQNVTTLWSSTTFKVWVGVRFSHFTLG